MFFFCFNLQCKGSRSYREANNLKSIYQHEYIAQEKINKKVVLKRVGANLIIHLSPFYFHLWVLCPGKTSD